MSIPSLRHIATPALTLALAAAAHAQSEFWLEFTGSATTSGAPIQDTLQTGLIDAEADVGRGELWARTTVAATNATQWTWMSCSFDDFVFSSPDDAPIDIQMNLVLDDLAFAGSPDFTKHTIWIDGLDGASAWAGQWNGAGDVTLNSSGVLGDFDFGMSEYAFTSGTFEVPVNVPVRLGFKFLVESSANSPGGTATCVTQGRLAFAKSAPAFLVPPGVTVNSVESVIIDNIHKPALTVRVPQDFAKIQDALSSTGDGSTIEISKGTYFETLDLSGKDDITLRAKGKVVIDAGFSGVPCLALEGCDNVRIEKLRFAGGTSGLTFENCEGVTIDKCRFEGQLGNALEVRESAGVIVEKCRIDDAGGAAFHIAESQDITLIKTRATLVPESEVGQIDQSSGVRIERCKIAGQGDSEGIAFGETTGLVIEKNRFIGLGGTAINGSAEGIVLERNTIKACRAGSSSTTPPTHSSSGTRC